MGKIIGIFDSNKARANNFMFDEYKKTLGIIISKNKICINNKISTLETEEELLDYVMENINYFYVGNIFINETIYIDKIKYIISVLRKKDTKVFISFSSFSDDLISLLDEIYIGDIINPTIRKKLSNSAKVVSNYYNN